MRRQGLPHQADSTGVGWSGGTQAINRYMDNVRELVPQSDVVTKASDETFAQRLGDGETPVVSERVVQAGRGEPGCRA